MAYLYDKTTNTEYEFECIEDVLENYSKLSPQARVLAIEMIGLWWVTSDEKSVKLLVDNFDINAQHKYQTRYSTYPSLMHIAVALGDPVLVKNLLDHGFDMTKYNQWSDWKRLVRWVKYDWTEFGWDENDDTESNTFHALELLRPYITDLPEKNDIVDFWHSQDAVKCKLDQVLLVKLSLDPEQAPYVYGQDD